MCNAWSNHRLLVACAGLDRDAYEATRTSFFPSIPLTLNHILTVDWYYLDALVKGGKGRSVFEPEYPMPAHADFAALAGAQRESDRALVDFVNRLDEGALDAPVDLERTDHVQVEKAVDVLFHLFSHQTHHRGQVHAMLAGTKVAPPQLDEYWLRAELPLREAELRELGLPLE